mmetsp:Transcript_3788/g.7635  ORF Transcript_3788/g.7635 Transcript_3788/m.7635 type:complete len:235 (-) Transcript_3788:3747-4451(-)
MQPRLLVFQHSHHPVLHALFSVLFFPCRRRCGRSLLLPLLFLGPIILVVGVLLSTGSTTDLIDLFINLFLLLLNLVRAKITNHNSSGRGGVRMTWNGTPGPRVVCRPGGKVRAGHYVLPLKTLILLCVHRRSAGSVTDSRPSDHGPLCRFPDPPLPFLSSLLPSPDLSLHVIGSHGLRRPARGSHGHDFIITERRLRDVFDSSHALNALDGVNSILQLFDERLNYAITSVALEQ